MKQIKLFSFAFLFLLAASCGGEKKSASDFKEGSTDNSTPKDPTSYDPKRGEGKFTAAGLVLTAGIDEKRAAEGLKVQGVKCGACHKLTDEKLVGPGWKGVTKRKAPEWIMNFITNPDPMIDKDPEVQAQLEICLVRMPNQSLTDDDARNILEFMRKNDQ